MARLASSSLRSIRRQPVADPAVGAGRRRRLDRRRRRGVRRSVRRTPARSCGVRPRPRCGGPATTRRVAAVACCGAVEVRHPAHRLIEDMSARPTSRADRAPSRPRRARARRPLPGRAGRLGRRQHADRRRRGHRARPAGHGQAGPPRVGRVGRRSASASRADDARRCRRSRTPTSPPSTTGARRQIGKRTTVYAVVEYLAGGSLRDLFDRGRYLDPSQALVVGLEACRGLDFAHRKGLVHTELTPSKLVFGDDRRLRIVDFGLARLLGEHDWAEPATRRHPRRPLRLARAGAGPADRRQDRRLLAGADPRRGRHRARCRSPPARPSPRCRPASAG